MKKLLLLAVTMSLFLALRWTLPAQETPPFRVIVHLENPTTSLPRTQVSKILLKRVRRWDHKEPVRPVDLLEDSAVRQTFSKDVHKRSASSIKSYWQRQIFSGRDTPPPEMPSDEAVMKFVKENPGGIGYISGRTPLDGVKEVTLSDE